MNFGQITRGLQNLARALNSFHKPFSMDITQLLNKNNPVPLSSVQSVHGHHNQAIPSTIDAALSLSQLSSQQTQQPQQNNVNDAQVPQTTLQSKSPSRAINTRQSHVLSEQRRRLQINEGFQELRQIIPFSADTSDSKASTLKKAITYIKFLQSEVGRLKDIIDGTMNGNDVTPPNSEFRNSPVMNGGWTYSPSGKIWTPFMPPTKELPTIELPPAVVNEANEEELSNFSGKRSNDSVEDDVKPKKGRRKKE